MNDSPVIEAVDLCKDFDVKRVLRQLNLVVPRGQIVGLLGKNGTGKSTFIKCLLGLLRASSGRCSLFGDDSWDLSAETKTRIGYVPQETELYPWMRIRQIIAYRGAFYPNWNQELAEHLLDRWELPSEERVGPLSTGQLQKLSLVLAMGHQPDLLLLDEPVASLDPVARRQFISELLTISADQERTVLFSTHITSDLERVADHVCILGQGKVICYEELDTLKESVKRLRITAACELPSTFAVSGALRTEVKGRIALVAVPRLSEHFIEELKSTWKAEVDVEDLNLEEIFLELHDE
jgi:ABC-2 type transport system ATP-binding protein